jgi:hypothetical protein
MRQAARASNISLRIVAPASGRRYKERTSTTAFFFDVKPILEMTLRLPTPVERSCITEDFEPLWE